MINSLNLRVDLSRAFVNSKINLHEGDVNGTEFVLSVYDNNSEFDLTGCTAEYDATIAGCLAEEAAAATITPDSNIIKVPVTANMTAMNGKLLIDVKIKKNNDILTVYTVSADVKRAVINGATIIDISGTTIMQKFNEIESMIAGLIDPSLSESGKAADAAAVGEALSGKAEKAPYSRFVYAVPNNISTLPDNAVRVDDATDPNVLYKYTVNGIVKGLIIAAADEDLSIPIQSQYYFGPDGKFRYRQRKSGEDWPSFGFSSLLDKMVFYKTAKDSASDISNPDREVLLADATDPNTLYRYNGQGLILPAVSSTTQTQYYFAEDGILRYRTRKRIGTNWESWPTKFKLVINQDILGKNLNPYLSPQNKLDKYFVRTCIDKIKVKLDECSCILGFGDSIMATSDGGSWLDILKTKVGYSTHYNYAIGNAHFSNNNYGGTRLITKLNAFFTDVDNQAIDASAINLIIVACGTNDAKNGTPISTFKTDVNEFFTSLKTGFTNRNIECPPVLVITPIRRGTEEEINAVSDDNLEIKVAKYGAILNNLALQAGFSVLNGFDIPVLVDDMDIDVGSNTATITSFMYDDNLHVHPNSTTGRTTYAQAVINAIGGSGGDVSTKMDLAPLNPTAEEIAAMPSGQIYDEADDGVVTIKGGTELLGVLTSSVNPEVGINGKAGQIARYGDSFYQCFGQNEQGTYVWKLISFAGSDVIKARATTTGASGDYIISSSTTLYEIWLLFREYHCVKVALTNQYGTPTGQVCWITNVTGNNNEKLSAFMLPTDTSSLSPVYQKIHFLEQNANSSSDTLRLVTKYVYPPYEEYYTKTEIDSKIGDIETALSEV